MLQPASAPRRKHKSVVLHDFPGSKNQSASNFIDIMGPTGVHPDITGRFPAAERDSDSVSALQAAGNHGWGQACAAQQCHHRLQLVRTLVLTDFHILGKSS